jgi:3-dehydroquinate synthase
VLVESGSLLALPALIAEQFPKRKIVVITDETVARRYDEWTQGTEEARRLGARSNDAGVRLQWDARLTFAPGEASKTRETWQELSDRMLSAGFGRDTAIVAIGGGVVGDVAGFVAATYLRGIPYVQVPTSLLAMVDASVGGKVGVDTPHGKNLIGAFHPPAMVLADPLTLLSLTEREYRGGLAETVKHGLIADLGYFEWMESASRPIGSREQTAVTRLVRRSIEIKAAVVSEDEREAGRRAILNAGHTVAHALERRSGYEIPHGEAVALGLIAECRLAEHLGLAESGLAFRVARLLATLGLRARLRVALGSAEDLVEAMRGDKKNREGVIRMALPAGLGRMCEGDGLWTVAVSDDAIRTGLAAIL